MILANIQRVGRTTIQILLFQAGTLVSVPTLIFASMFLWGISVLLSVLGLDASALMPQLLALNPAALVLALTLVYGVAYVINTTSDAFEDFGLEKLSSALFSSILIAVISIVVVVGESQVLPYTVGMLMLRILSAVLTLFGVAYLFESRGGFYLEFLKERASLTRGLLSIIGVALTSVVSSSFLTSGNLLISRDAGLLAGTVFLAVVYFFFRKVPVVGIAVVSLILSLCTFVVQPEKLLAVFAVASGTMVTNQCEVQMLEQMRAFWTKRQILAFYFCAVILSFIWAYFYTSESWWVIPTFGLIFAGLGKVIGLSPTQWKT